MTTNKHNLPVPAPALPKAPRLKGGDDDKVAARFKSLFESAEDAKLRIMAFGIYATHVKYNCLKHGQYGDWATATLGGENHYRSARDYVLFTETCLEKAGIKNLKAEVAKWQNLPICHTGKFLLLPEAKVPKSIKPLREKVFEILANKTRHQLCLEWKQAKENEAGLPVPTRGRPPGQGGASAQQRAAAKAEMEKAETQALNLAAKEFCKWALENADDEHIGKRLTDENKATLLEAAQTLVDYLAHHQPRKSDPSESSDHSDSHPSALKHAVVPCDQCGCDSGASLPIIRCRSCGHYFCCDCSGDHECGTRFKSAEQVEAETKAQTRALAGVENRLDTVSKAKREALPKILPNGMAVPIAKPAQVICNLGDCPKLQQCLHGKAHAHGEHCAAHFCPDYLNQVTTAVCIPLPQSGKTITLEQAKKKAPKPFGYEVTVAFHPGSGKPDATFHMRGSESQARRHGMLKANADHIVSVTPMTEEQYHRAYGHPGRM